MEGPDTGLPRLRFNRRMITLAVCLTALAIAVIVEGPLVIHASAVDWFGAYLPGVRDLLHGVNPYTDNLGFYNPPWVLLLVAPFALLPPEISVYAYLGFTIFSYAFIARKLGAGPLAWTAFVLSPPVLLSLIVLNVDVFVLWGFLLPPPLALLFVLIKPQMGAIFAVYLLLEAWRTGGIRKLISTAWPTAVAFLISFLMFGNWITLQAASGGNWRPGTLLEQRWNMSVFPYGLLLGIPLLVAALVLRKKDAAKAASPFFSPYVTMASWSASLAGCLRNDTLTVLAVATLYVLKLTLWA